MDFVIRPLEMISGIEEAAQRRYELIETPSGNWLYAPQVANCADHIYFHNPKDVRSQGFGGATLKFELSNDQVYEATGPWHSNSDSFHRATGVDVRDRHWTRVVLSKGKRWDKHLAVMEDVVYYDEGMVGRFDRYKELAKQFPAANFYYSESRGGSSCGPIRDEDRE